MLNNEAGLLEYFVNEQSRNQKPRGSLPLAGAVISPSDEDSHTFTVNAISGEQYKLRGCHMTCFTLFLLLFKILDGFTSFYLYSALLSITQVFCKNATYANVSLVLILCNFSLRCKGATALGQPTADLCAAPHGGNGQSETCIQTPVIMLTPL